MKKTFAIAITALALLGAASSARASDICDTYGEAFCTALALFSKIHSDRLQEFSRKTIEAMKNYEEQKDPEEADRGEERQHEERMEELKPSHRSAKQGSPYDFPVSAQPVFLGDDSRND